MHRALSRAGLTTSGRYHRPFLRKDVFPSTLRQSHCFDMTCIMSVDPILLLLVVIGIGHDAESSR